MKRDQAKRQQWQQHIAQWQQSTLSQRAFCEHAGLKFATFDYWRRALIAEQAVDSLVAPQSQQPGIALLPVQVTSATSTPTGLVLRSPQGWELRLPSVVPDRLAAHPAAWSVMQWQAEAIWLAVQPVDIRAGIDRLSTYVQQALGRMPCDGTAYVFSNRRHTRLKVVCWDGNGVWMGVRRLHRGQFVWPKPGETCWQLTAEQWQWLVAGVDWQRLSAPAPVAWTL